MRKMLGRDLGVWSLIVVFLASSVAPAARAQAPAALAGRSVQLPAQVGTSDPFHPTFGLRHYNREVPQDFIARATSKEVRTLVAGLKADERKLYVDRLNQIYQDQIDKFPRPSAPLKAVGINNLLEMKAGQVAPDMMAISTFSEKGERFTLSAHYQEGRIPNIDPSSARGGIIPPAYLQNASNDGDVLDDAFEDAVADAFTPLYVISQLEVDSFCTFANRPDTQQVTSLQGPYPLSYFRVTPLGLFYSEGQQYGALRVDYLSLWNRDSGFVGGGGACALDLLGLTGILNLFASHDLDNERSAALLIAPVSSPDTYNADPAAYGAYAYYLAAHEGFPAGFDASTVLYPSAPVPAGQHLALFPSLSKHATYSFNPNYKPLAPIAYLLSTIAFLDFLLATGQISELEYLIYTGLAYDTYYGCLVERFVMPPVGYYANPRINVGEVNNPINGSAFIQSDDPKLRSKLEAPIPW